MCIFAAALDPRFRKLKFLSTDDILKVKNKLQTLALEARRVQVRQEPEDDSPSGQPDHSRQKPKSVLDMLLGTDEEEELEDEDPGQDQREDAVRNELLVYFGEKPIPKDKNPLQWWKENETKFPALAVVAKSYLAAPATSTPSERLFSAAGSIVNKKRASLTTKSTWTCSHSYTMFIFALHFIIFCTGENGLCWDSITENRNFIVLHSQECLYCAIMCFFALKLLNFLDNSYVGEIKE